MATEQPAPETILARNFIAAIMTPAFIVDPDGLMTFFNEAAGQLIGRHFEETGRLTREEWNSIGPVDEDGRPIPSDRMPMTVALREGLPAYGRFRIKTDQGILMDVDTSAIPLMARGVSHGAIVTFVPAVPGNASIERVDVSLRPSGGEPDEDA
jgi:PAS domain-containing protein